MKINKTKLKIKLIGFWFYFVNRAIVFLSSPIILINVFTACLTLLNRWATDINNREFDV